MGLGEASLVFDRGEPGIEEVGAERHDELGLREVVRRQLIHAEHSLVGQAQRLVIERLPTHDTPTECRGPLREKIGKRAAAGAGNHRELAAGDLGRQPRDRIVPRRGLEGAVGIPHHRALDPARIVESLQCRLAARAELPLVDGVLGIPLELDGPSLTRPHVNTATGGALGARARVPGRDAGDLILRLHQVRHQSLDVARRASAQRQRTARRHRGR